MAQSRERKISIERKRRRRRREREILFPRISREKKIWKFRGKKEREGRCFLLPSSSRMALSWRQPWETASKLFIFSPFFFEINKKITK